MTDDVVTDPYQYADRSTELLVVTWVLTMLALIVVGLKHFNGSKLPEKFGLDDFFVSVSLVC